MSEDTLLDQELERRLAIIEAEELDDPVHAALSGRSFGLFLAVAAGIVIAAVIGVAL